MRANATRVVVDGQVHGIPADAAVVVLGSIAGDSMSDAFDLAQAFGVDVEQLARHFAFIANDRLNGIQGLQP